MAFFGPVFRAWARHDEAPAGWPDLRGCDPLAPQHPPFQQVAADARRLHRLMDELPRGASFVRSVGVWRAYDRVLAIACEQLEISTRLVELPFGNDRTLERSRVEFMLTEAGLRLN